MICAQHNWWDAENSCPECGGPDPEPAAVTAAETALTAMPDIPDFLKRAPDNTLASPRPRDGTCFDWTPNEQRCPEHRDWSEQSDAELYEALNNSELSLVERQPIYLELRRREDRKKSLARIAEMKDKRAVKEDATK